MSIKYVVLGYLGWRPMSGYNIKKVIAESETLPWTASSNEIYHALVALQRDKWITKHVEPQNNYPIYTITEAGLDALKQWIVSIPEPPETKRSFLNQLLWADCLSVKEMDELLEAYLQTVGEKLFFLRVQADEKTNMPERTPRETYLWEMIHKNWIAHYELELRWIREIRQGLLMSEEKRRRMSKHARK